MRTICTIDGCDRKVVGHGWCRKHYDRWYRNGDPTVVQRPAPIQYDSSEEYFVAHVEKTASCWNWTGQINDRGYGIANHEVRQRTGERRAHRFGYELLVGPIPDGMQLDHTCHNKHCVNPDHLRIVTGKQNHENLSGPYKNSSSGVRGVWRHKHSGKWMASVRHNSRDHHVGYFSDLADAEAAVIEKRKQLFTHNDMDRVSP